MGEVSALGHGHFHGLARTLEAERVLEAECVVLRCCHRGSSQE